MRTEIKLSKALKSAILKVLFTFAPIIYTTFCFTSLEYKYILRKKTFWKEIPF